MSPRAQLALCLLLALAFAAPARAQLIRVEGGASDTLNADGGEIEFQSRDYRGYTSLGEIQGRLLFGSYLTTVFHGYNFTAGDSPVALDLPTDIFDSVHYVVTRGVGVSRKFGDGDLYVFGGESAIAAGTPFFQAASDDSPTAMAFLHKPLSKSVTFFSRNVIAKDNTSIQGLDWKPSNWMHAAAAGGIGSGSSYGALSSDFEHRWLSLKVAYIAAGDRFRRFTVQTPLSSEVIGANALLTLHPRRDLIIVTGHQNYLEPQTSVTAPPQKATVNDIQSDWTSRYLQLGGGVFSSSAAGRHGFAEALWASRHIIRNVDGGVNVFHSKSGSGPATSTVLGNIRETLSPRLSMLEIVGHSAGQNQFMMGGTFISNRFSIDVNYQTIFLPYRTNPFQQGLAANLTLRMAGDVQLNGQTFVGSDGKVHYTAFGSKVFERAFGWLGSGPQQSYHFARFVIKGKVVDEQGQPVPGATLQIGKELVVTNQDGEFFLRTSHREAVPLQIAFDQFINPTPLELRSAPKELTPEPEDSAIGVTIVLAHPTAPKDPQQ
jgi:hypothetical protein